MISWLVDRLNVSLTDREVIAEFRRRMVNLQKTREERKQVYRCALERHHHNQVAYNAVMSGRFSLRCKGPCQYCD